MQQPSLITCNKRKRNSKVAKPKLTNGKNNSLKHRSTSGFKLVALCHAHAQWQCTHSMKLLHTETINSISYMYDVDKWNSYSWTIKIYNHHPRAYHGPKWQPAPSWPDTKFNALALQRSGLRSLCSSLKFSDLSCYYLCSAKNFQDDTHKVSCM